MIDLAGISNIHRVTGLSGISGKKLYKVIEINVESVNANFSISNMTGKLECQFLLRLPPGCSIPSPWQGRSRTTDVYGAQHAQIDASADYQHNSGQT